MKLSDNSPRRHLSRFARNFSRRAPLHSRSLPAPAEGGEQAQSSRSTTTTSTSTTTSTESPLHVLTNPSPTSAPDHREVSDPLIPTPSTRGNSDAVTMDGLSFASMSHSMRSNHSHSIPGSFDDDDNDLPPFLSNHNSSFSQHDSSPPAELALPPLPTGDNSLLHDVHSSPGITLDSDRIDEREMRKKLMDMESSFLPEPSMIGPASITGADDSILGVSHPSNINSLQSDRLKKSSAKGLNLAENDVIQEEEDSFDLDEPPTPPGRYTTPGLIRANSPGIVNVEDSHLDTENVSSLEAMSSPTAAALARTVHRAASMATMGSFETANEQSLEHMADESEGAVEFDRTREQEDSTAEEETTPKKPVLPSSTDRTVDPPKIDFTAKEPEKREKPEQVNDKHFASSTSTTQHRPRQLNSRSASQRSSISSYAGSMDNVSEVTLGADYALQSGGALPSVSSRNRHSSELTRSISLGSIASGISMLGDITDKDHTSTSGSTKQEFAESGFDRPMPQVPEEEDQSIDLDIRSKSASLKTPKANGKTFIAPTDTVIARHVQNLQIPDAVAAEYRQTNGVSSPTKKSVVGPTPKKGAKNLTLKEQTSTIDKLTKENFNLKLKIWALETSLDKRSEEGIKEMISENVELKAGYTTAQKEIKTLKKQVRTLETRLKELEQDQAAKTGSDNERGPASIDPDEALQMEETIAYLRERTETYEYELEKLQRDGIVKEGEKRKLAEMVNILSEKRARGSSVASQEVADSWRDLFEAEQARRAETDDENRRLREELLRLRNDKVVSREGRPQTSSSASDSGTESYLQFLRQDNQNLRAQLLSQTSMLTSRNKEMDRLYNEIEDLKLGVIPGDGARSVAGDSIFERSASRAFERPMSRHSGRQKSQISDSEREEFDRKEGNLLDQILSLKLTNQELDQELKKTSGLRTEYDELDRELNQCIDDLTSRETELQDAKDKLSACEGDLEDVTQSLQQMQLERNELLGNLEAKEVEVEELRAEAQGEIDALDEALAKAESNLQQLKTERDIKVEDFDALQHHTRTLNDMSVRFEDQKIADDQMIQALERDIEEAREELQHARKDLSESNSKIERLTVEQESSQQRIAFLNEEQEGDKITIGNLQASITRAESGLSDEKEKSRDLERRLSAERHQREIVGGQEKQEVQRMMSDLNLQINSVKDEARKLRRSLSVRESEASDWKTRFAELDNSLRSVLGESSGTNIVKIVQTLQKNLMARSSELEEAHSQLSEKENLVKSRDGLLERSSLDTKRLTDLLEKERTARRLESHQCEQIQRTSEQTHRFLKNQEAKVKELENARGADRRKLSSLDARYRDQLHDRNALLLTLWNRLSVICGTDWAHKHSLVNGRALPSLDVIANQLPGFSQNLQHAIKSVESILQSFKSRIRTTERDLWKSYQTLEHNVDVKLKRLDRLEVMVNSGRITAPQGSKEEQDLIAKFKGENKLLKAELAVLHKQGASARATVADKASDEQQPVESEANTQRAVSIATRPRQNSSSGGSATGAADPTALARAFNPSATYVHNAASPTDPSEQRWILRLRELERRLKAEREARLQDRTGARKRLEEGRAENEELKMELQRERIRHGAE